MVRSNQFQDRKSAHLGYENEVRDLRTSEPITSAPFVAQMVLLGICALTAWLLLGLWEAIAWFVIFAVMTFLEKLIIHRLPDAISTVQFNTARAIIFVNAIIFDAMPVYLWFHENDMLKFGTLAIVTGLIMNNLNIRARFTSILICVQIPNALMFLVIGAGLIWMEGWTPGAVTVGVVAVAIVIYFFVNLRVAHLKEKGAAETKEQLQYAQRAEVIGQVTGGVAHDFNNIISVIYASLDLLKIEKDEKERANLIEQALIAVENGANLTRQMLAFGRRAPLMPDIVDVNVSLQSLRNLIVRVIPATIKVSIEIDPNLSRIKVDDNAFHSALMNLALNAESAMPDGGTLTISAKNIRDPHLGNGSMQKTGKAVEIRVTDTGSGIPNDILERIFDPFFTTKEVGEGSGMGLPMVKGFVEQSGGRIHVDSHVGQGTAVCLTFPAVSEVVPEQRELISEATKDDVHGHILLVDDNEQLLSLLSTKLQRDGHQVSAFASGDEAALALDRGLKPDLVLSDVVMRGTVQGTDLVGLARQTHADLPFILMSGYADAGEKSGFDRSSVDAFLEKPVQLSEVSKLIQGCCLGFLGD